ncbi:MAG: hypothetical protein WC307_01125 [Candidatus Nanoarchaeia archaeon]|jgi:hypothetical protein
MVDNSLMNGDKLIEQGFLIQKKINRSLGFSATELEKIINWLTFNSAKEELLKKHRQKAQRLSELDFKHSRNSFNIWAHRVDYSSPNLSRLSDIDMIFLKDSFKPFIECDSFENELLTNLYFHRLKVDYLVNKSEGDERLTPYFMMKFKESVDLPVPELFTQVFNSTPYPCIEEQLLQSFNESYSNNPFYSFIETSLNLMDESFVKNSIDKVISYYANNFTIPEEIEKSINSQFLGDSSKDSLLKLMACYELKKSLVLPDNNLVNNYLDENLKKSLYGIVTKTFDKDFLWHITKEEIKKIAGDDFPISELVAKYFNPSN